MARARLTPPWRARAATGARPAGGGPEPVSRKENDVQTAWLLLAVIITVFLVHDRGG